jgi:CheY-like chemotaxis protein
VAGRRTRGGDGCGFVCADADSRPNRKLDGGSIMARILLVEDDEMSRDMMSRRLMRRGYDVITAIDGQQAVGLASSESPALILLDLSLPVMDGWAVARTLKAAPATSSIPIIALTAHAMSGDREKALEAGCDEYDTKPVEFKRLLGKIRLLLGEASS